MKNFKIAALALVIAASFAACKGSGSEGADTLSKDTITAGDTLSKDTTKKM